MFDIILQRMYELMIVAKSDGADALFAKVEKMIKDASASSLSSEKMGKKPLAYTIAKQTEAEYFLFNFDVSGEAVNSISNSLRLEQESILRYMIISTKVRAKKAKVEKAVKDAKEAEPKVEKKAEEKVAKSEKKTDTKKATKTSKGKKV